MGSAGLRPIASGLGDGSGWFVSEGGGELAEAPGQTRVAEWNVCEFIHDQCAESVVHSQLMS